MKKAGFILFLAGLTLGLAAVSTPFVMVPGLMVREFEQQPRPVELADGIAASMTWTYLLGIAAVAFTLIGACLLIAGMIRSGPRDEELPTADAAVPRETRGRR